MKKIMISKSKRSMPAWIAVFAGLILLSFNVRAETFTYSAFTPPPAPANVGIRDFINQAQKDTQGKVKFDLYQSGALTFGKTTLSGIRNGLVDGGLLISVYTPSSLPVNVVFSDLSFFNTDPRVTAAAITDTTLNDCPECLAEYKKHNVHFLSSFATAPYYAMCKKKMAAFDPHGLRMRAPGDEIAKWIKDMGGVPVHMANADAYQALQRNTLDCSLGAALWLHTYSWEEVVHTVVKLPMGGYQGGALVDLAQNKWKALDSGTRTALEKAALEGTAAAEYDFVRKTRKVSDQAKSKYGVRFIKAPANLVAKRETFKRSEVQRSIAKAKARGVKNPAELVQAFQKNLKKWQALIGDKTLTQQQYADLLIQNILGAQH